MTKQELIIIAKSITDVFAPIGETSVIELTKKNNYSFERFSKKFGDGIKETKSNLKIYSELKGISEGKIPKFYDRTYKGKNWKCVALPFKDKDSILLLIINFDTTFFFSIKSFIDQFVSVDSEHRTQGNSFPTLVKIQEVITDYCFKNILNPLHLSKKHKKNIVKI